MYTTLLPGIDMRDLFSDSSNSFYSYLPKNRTFYSRGRVALGIGIDALGLSKGNGVLLPASICREVLIPFLERGISIFYYALDSNLQPKFDDLSSKVTKNIHAIYVNHYFGYPTDCGNIRKLCDSKGIFLIEDCAHGFLNQDLGKTGDISIYSFWKFLPVPLGGGLVIKSGEKNVNKLEKPNIVLMWLKLILYSLSLKGVLPIKTLRKLMGKEQKYPEWVDDIETGFNFAPGLPESCLKLIERIDCDDVIKYRNKNYKYWDENLPKSIKPLWKEFPKDAVPFSYPFLLQSKDQRNRVFKAMASYGIYLEPGINYTYRNHILIKNAEEQFSEINFCADRCLSLPVHQTLKHSQLKFIKKILHNES